MTPPPIVYFLHASDAPQHYGKMQSLLAQFKTDKRINDFISIDIEVVGAAIPQQFKNGDVIVMLLTTGMDGKRNSILNLLSQTKTTFPEARIIQIIVDNIPFANDYIVLPTDQKPIRAAHDMDQAWSGIEENLKQTLPAPASPLSKYIKYAVIIMILLIILLIWRPWSGNVRPAPEDIGPDPRADTIRH